MSYYVYILKSQPTDKYYIGSSENPERRLIYHNTIGKGFTSRYRPWEMVYKKECETREQAQIVERKIKSWKSRIMIGRLISAEISL